MQIAEDLKECIQSGEAMVVYPGDDERLIRMLLKYEFQSPLGVKQPFYLICRKSKPVGLPPNFFAFGPDDIETEVYRAFVANPGLPIPPICVSFVKELRPHIRGIFERVVIYRYRRLIKILRQDWEHYGKWYYPERPRILLQTSRFTTVLQYCTSDLSDGFKELGLETEISKEREPWERMDRLATQESIHSFRPDMVVCVDGIRHHNCFDLPAHVPYVGWAQDRLPRLLDPAAAKAQGKADFQFSMWPGMSKEMHEVGHKGVESMPMAVNQNVYKPGPAPDKFKCDIAYITNVPKGASDARVKDRLDEAARFVGAGFKVNLYGDGWGETDLKSFWRGKVSQGAELRDAYAGAKLVLHVNEDTMVHQRVMESIAAGTLPLIRYVPSDAFYFGTVFGPACPPTYADWNWKEVTTRLLTQPDYYNSVLEKCRAWVLGHHTYKARAQHILDAVRRRLA